MSLKKWAASGQLKAHETSKKEIDNLFAIVERELRDSAVESLSTDARFVMAYNAALKLCTIVLYGAGYRTSGAGAHHRTIEALPEILGESCQADADYLDKCRSQRNHAEYDYVNVVEESDVKELIAFVGELKTRVLIWLKTKEDQINESP
jgi:hypothetical protein